MAETSSPWGGTTIGDATLAPYTDDAWSDIWKAIFNVDNTKEGVLFGRLNELEVTGAVSPVAINTGYAIVDGKFYGNSASLNVVVATPAVSTRKDIIVLRKDFAAQTVRIAKVAGVEGGAAPTVTQIDGTTWEILLAEISITTLGAITVTDKRQSALPHKFTLNFPIGTGVAVPSTGIQYYQRLPEFNFKILAWELVADAAGSAVVDLWVDLYANYPPVVADTICGSEKPTLTAQQKNTDTTPFSGGVTVVPKGCYVCVNLDSVATCKFLNLVLICEG